MSDEKKPLNNNKTKLLIGGAVTATVLLGGVAGAFYLNGSFNNNAKSKPAISQNVNKEAEATPYEETEQNKDKDASKERDEAIEKAINGENDYGQIAKDIENQSNTISDSERIVASYTNKSEDDSILDSADNTPVGDKQLLAVLGGDKDRSGKLLASADKKDVKVIPAVNKPHDNSDNDGGGTNPTNPTDPGNGGGTNPTNPTDPENPIDIIVKEKLNEATEKQNLANSKLEEAEQIKEDLSEKVNASKEEQEKAAKEISDKLNEYDQLVEKANSAYEIANIIYGYSKERPLTIAEQSSYAEAIKRFKESTQAANETLSELKNKKDNLKQLNEKIGAQIDERTQSLTETKEKIDQANDDAQKAIDAAKEKDTDKKYSDEIEKAEKVNAGNKEKAQEVAKDIEQSKQDKVDADKKAQEIENATDNGIKEREESHKDLEEKQKVIDTMPDELPNDFNKDPKIESQQEQPATSTKVSAQEKLKTTTVNADQKDEVQPVASTKENVAENNVTKTTADNTTDETNAKEETKVTKQQVDQNKTEQPSDVEVKTIDQNKN
ncbi:hypothetical protein [Bacillus glycinifermentans]|uniref:Uncharacterized protein n=1 Tax=Bacillus glycinifermentans TaxID=1664069 RepID=A0A0T6BIE4_9BACI|nr:hypothetical protein [Bacillus glycinifermentans]KRT87126.1 hypothetical protein AB447_209160 [Bacillus glycinifermentans]